MNTPYTTGFPGREYAGIILRNIPTSQLEYIPTMLRIIPTVHEKFISYKST
jgi:hypothetical protein